MKRTDNLQQAAVPLNNYQFDFGLPGMSKPSGSLKDQQKAQTLKSASQASAGWSASPGGWGSSQSGSGSDQAFDFFGRSNGGGASNPNVGAQPRPQMGGNVSSTYDFLGKPNPMAAGGGGGGGYYGSKPQVGNVTGMSSFLSQTGSQAKGGVDLSGKSWGQTTTASKLASAGIPGYKPSSKEDVFGDLLGGALGGKSSAPLKQQQAAASAGAYGMSNLQSAMPEVTKAQVQEKPAKPAPFSYTAMFKSPTPPPQKPAPKPQARGGGPFADISFSKPANGPSTDPFDFGIKKQTAPPPPAPAARPPSSDPFGSSAGVDQFDSIFGSAPSAKTAQAHDGWGDAFGAAAESHSFADEGVTTELEGVGAAPAGVTGSSASQKGSTFYKEGQFPNAIKWFSWAVELLEKEKASKDAIIEVLTKRISCFKEIGEMKKAIADCTKACELKPGCVELLMQRAHLYESCEKIKLGIADLREVLKIEPSHRLAQQTVARLEKML